VLLLGLHRLELAPRLLERREAVGPASGDDPPDRRLGRLRIGVRPHGGEDVDLVVEDDDADHVPLVKRADRQRRRLVGDLLLRSIGAHDAATHRPRVVEHEADGDLGRDKLVWKVEADGEDGLDRRSPPTPGAEALGPADHHQPAAEVAHVVDQRLLRLAGEGIGRHVLEHHHVIRLEPKQIGGESRRAHQGHADPRAFERLGQDRPARAGRTVANPVHDQHAPLARRDRERLPPVVVRERVRSLIGLEDRSEPVHTRLVQLDLEELKVFPGRQRHPPLLRAVRESHRLVVLQQAQRPRCLRSGRERHAHHDPGSGSGAGRCVHGLDHHLVRERVAQRHDVDRHPAASLSPGARELPRGRNSVAGRLIPVREEDDATRRLRRDHRRRKLQPLGDVRPVGARRVERSRKGPGSRRADDRRGARVERDDPVHVVSLAPGSGRQRGQNAPHLLQRRHGSAGPDARREAAHRARSVHDGDHRQPVRSLLPRRATKRPGDQPQQDQPQEHRRPSPPDPHRAHPRQRRSAHRDDPDDQEKPLGLVEAEVHGTQDPPLAGASGAASTGAGRAAGSMRSA
jgi:hypothetical protein